MAKPPALLVRLQLHTETLLPVNSADTRSVVRRTRSTSRHAQRGSRYAQ